MNADVARALENDRTIDITTTGRRTGAPRRKEIWFHNIEGHLFITGLPGRRDWYADLRAHPEFTFHLKQSVRANLAARATPVLDEEQRRDIIAKIHQNIGQNTGGNRDLDAWVASSPLVEVELQPQ